MFLANRLYCPSLLFLWLQGNVVHLFGKLTFSQLTETVVAATVTQDILVVLLKTVNMYVKYMCSHSSI